LSYPDVQLEVSGVLPMEEVISQSLFYNVKQCFVLLFLIICNPALFFNNFFFAKAIDIFV